MITIEQFSQIVTEVHSAATAPDKWVDALELVRVTLGGTACGLISGGNGYRDVKHCSMYDAPAMQEYHEYYRTFDYVLAAVDVSPVGLVHAGEPLVALNPHSEFNFDWMRPHAMDDGLFVRITDGPRPVSFLVAAPKRGDSFAGPDNMRAVNLLVPHLQHALRTQQTLTELHDDTGRPAHPVDSMSAPAAVLGADMTVVHANHAFESLLGCNTAFSVKAGRLGLTLARADIEFRRTVADATGIGTRTGDSLRVPRAGGSRPLILHVAPLWDSGLPCAMVVVVDPDGSREPPKDLLRRIFSLTNAEAEVALRVARGQILSAIADELSLTMATIKTHLQHVYDKTDTHRQAELVRLLLAITP